MIVIEDVDLYINGKHLLQDINLDIPKGSVYALMGANGSGKTLLLKSIMGVIQTNSGTITIDGNTLTEQTKNKIFRNIGVLIETPPLYAHLTVRENLKIRQLMLGIDPSSIDYVIDFCHLSEHKNKKTDQLSLGSKQRLGLALAFIAQPEIIVLDEPSSTLDPKASVEFRELVSMINKKSGTTFLIASHNLEEVAEIATHLCFIAKGKIRMADKVSSIFEARQISVNGEKEKLTAFIEELTENNVYKERRNATELIITTLSEEMCWEITRQLKLKSLSHTISNTTTQTLKRLFYD